ncbi:WXG100 family type VII secretion target [Corynebacterium sp. CCM 8835]|uniref:ESAT-6-like protein n=1 Tax=Corynebacterium antarcticum TaxID=2800405 RepID=A0A9Q4CEH3_9CORY|nr:MULTISPECIES: WXG100 family type VII secretion target [Corynebacterium]MBV7292689.1 WXG100 family type VII secretion target [Corynebacterium sp. TAE3-ERU16]MCK7642334.1 WXG100 family type VII secretion target [Corynebacterium antarcticum]MCK7660981.1 WXG100 family type VII secretion target [Corynebacterium antarcticum]MCL0245729.1 WXG100 family type VII secretion target [Corynebacterium antarcticum]MCX7491815.1 WXG100 family type VII secretion target [Corynebacterium antarcticum]
MESTIRYQFGEIAAVVGDIRATSGRISQQLEEIKRQIRPMAEAWEGDSAVEYQAAQQKWDNAAAELNLILDTIARTVGEGNDRMSDINRRAAASWS